MIYFNNTKLKEKIRRSGMKAGFIAETLGIHRVTLSYYCMGERKPKKETLKLIARMIRCKLGDFYDSKEEREESREHRDDSQKL